MSEIWAILEQSEGSLHEQSAELVAELAEIAGRQAGQTQLCAVLLTAPGEARPDTSALAGTGIDYLYFIEHPLLATYDTESQVAALAWLIRQRSPALLAAGATANGRDWAPRLAARLRLPFAPNCLGLDLQDNALIALRALYAGRAYARTGTPLYGRTALATLIPNVRGAPVTRTAREQEPEIITFTPEIAQWRERGHVRHLGIQAPSAEEVELEEAQKIVAGGRGVGREGFATLAKFARHLRAALGASRVATDRGWVEQERQIGATGKSVRPQLYIACGISGAAQHTSGIREAKTIIAINPDRSAPIFALADLGLLGDANEVLAEAGALLENEREPAT